MIVMKQCEMLGGICPVCHVYAHLVLGCVFVSFWVCRVVVHLGVHFFILCWSMLLCEVLGLPCMPFFLFGRVLVAGDVISSGCAVSDWSL